MDPEHASDRIDKPTFEWALKQYSSSLTTADDGDHLDKLRYNTIPDAVKARQEDPHLDKEELVMLVTWKLKHGVFRPALKGMVQQNSTKDVKETSRTGFTQYNNGSSKDAIKILANLRGIGPATASLMLSVYDPEKAPFFSDELYRWAFFEAGKGNGWDRRIKYTAKEYAELSDKVAELLTRLDVSAVDVEKVAYVLGREALIGQGPGEDMGKSSKRKAEQTDRNVVAIPTSSNITATNLPGKLEPDDEEVDAAKETTKEQPADASPKSRPKRKRTKRST